VLTTDGWLSQQSNPQSYIDTEQERKKKKKLKKSSKRKAENLCIYKIKNEETKIELNSSKERKYFDLNRGLVSNNGSLLYPTHSWSTSWNLFPSSLTNQSFQFLANQRTTDSFLLGTRADDKELQDHIKVSLSIAGINSLSTNLKESVYSICSHFQDISAQKLKIEEELMNKSELIRILNTNIVNLCKQKHSLKKRYKQMVKKQSQTII